jgi:hypothetical protein
MKTYSSLLLTIITTFSLNVFAQDNIRVKQPKDTRVADALEFLMSQETMLKRIETEIPHLALQVMVVRNKFSQTFGEACKGFDNFFIERFGNEKHSKFKNDLQIKFDSILTQQVLVEENALSFIDEVKNRANGRFADSTVLETLLAFQYANHPHEEFLNGFTQTFSTKNHPKGRNSDCLIRVPISWRADEGNRPHIVQKFRDEFGNGRQLFVMEINELPIEKDQDLQIDMNEAIFSDSGIVSLLPSGATLLSHKQIILGGIKGAMVESEFIAKQIKIRSVLFFTVYDNLRYSMGFSVSSLNPETDLDADMQKYMPLFKLMANSLILNNRYK